MRFYSVLCGTRKLVRLNKRVKIFLNYFLGPLLFIWLSYSIYRQVKEQPDLQDSWRSIQAALQGSHIQASAGLLALMLLNFLLESLKWYTLVRRIEPISFGRAVRAVFAGQAIGFSSINRIGETASRNIYLSEGNRIKGLAMTLVGNIAQILITLVFGLAAMCYMRIFILDATHSVEGLSILWMNGLMTLLSLAAALFLLLYFRLSFAIRLLEKIPWVRKYRFAIEHMEDLSPAFLWRVLIIAMFRYLVFVVQYVLLLKIFLDNVPMLDAAVLVCVLLLVMSVIPTISLAELGVRGQVSILLFGLISTNIVGIIATAGGIWIINLLLPAIIGTLMLLGIRLFRNSN